MSTYVFFDAAKLGSDVRQALAAGDAKTHHSLDIGGRRTFVQTRDGEVFVQIDRKNQLTDKAWTAVNRVSIRENVTDLAMVNQMASGEYGPDESGTTATVQLWTSGEDYTSIVGAEIEIIAPTWEAATDFHRSILFGKLPDRPYVRPREIESEV